MAYCTCTPAGRTLLLTTTNRLAGAPLQPVMHVVLKTLPGQFLATLISKAGLSLSKEKLVCVSHHLLCPPLQSI